MRIHKLSKVLANQIAAGEVIERPSSVVKELLENSIDAGSSEISLDIQKGGRSLISIKDNGTGIHPDDLSLALCQHATSKLAVEGNLLNIRTLGFRGEALSSIAAISRLMLASRMANHDHGWTITATSGDMTERQPIAMPVVGTSVEVQDMFFNIPARRKFLRTDNTEFFHIRETVKRIALSRHDISFHLQHNGKGILKISSGSGNIDERVQAIFGKSFLDNTFKLDRECHGLRLWGWFGHPEIARNQVDQQYFYLNGRMIRDKQINHAVRMIADEHFYTGKHAVYVLFLEMDPAEVDVNVHPAKYEVRFRQARDVHDFILSALRELFVSIHTLAPPPESTSSELEIAQTGVSRSGVTQPSKLMADDRGNTPYEHGISQGPRALLHNTEGNTPKHAVFQQSHSRRYYASSSMRGGTAQQAQQLFLEPSGFLLIEDHYLIVQSNEEVFFLDVFLCNEMIVSADLQSDFSESSIGRRPLLVPLSINISTEQGDFFESERSMFEKFGVLLERISAESIVVREIPLLLEYADITELINDMTTVIKAAKPEQEVLEVMAKHTNDAGVGKMDNQVVARLLDKVKRIKSTRRTWCRLDKTMLANLLKSKA